MYVISFGSSPPNPKKPAVAGFFASNPGIPQHCWQPCHHRCWCVPSRKSQPGCFLILATRFAMLLALALIHAKRQLQQAGNVLAHGGGERFRKVKVRISALIVEVALCR